MPHLAQTCINHVQTEWSYLSYSYMYLIMIYDYIKKSALYGFFIDFPWNWICSRQSQNEDRQKEGYG